MLYGTNWVTKPTTIGNILETVNSLPAYLDGDDKPSFAYTNIAGLIKEYCRTHNISPVPFVAVEMCSGFTEYNRRMWESSLDMCLHDAAVHHTFQAARRDTLIGRECEAAIACDLWFWSRQLRKDVAEEMVRYVRDR
jgi:hypothetical protein